MAGLVATTDIGLCFCDAEAFLSENKHLPHQVPGHLQAGSVIKSLIQSLHKHPPFLLFYLPPPKNAIKLFVTKSSPSCIIDKKTKRRRWRP
jgi:hypothetical protein